MGNRQRKRVILPINKLVLSVGPTANGVISGAPYTASVTDGSVASGEPTSLTVTARNRSARSPHMRERTSPSATPAEQLGRKPLQIFLHYVVVSMQNSPPLPKFMATSRSSTRYNAQANRHISLLDPSGLHIIKSCRIPQERVSCRWSVGY